MLIWKEELPSDTLDLIKIDLPFDSVETIKKHILKVDTQYGTPVMWFQADDDNDGQVRNMNTFVIQGIGTGHPYTDDASRRVINMQSYIGSVSLMNGVLILHYFVMTVDDCKEKI